MFRRISAAARSLHDLLEDIRALLQGVVSALQEREDTDLAARVEKLELGRAMWEAEVEALLLKATDEKKRARAAEERARKREKRAEDDAGDEYSLEDLPPEYLALLQAGNGPEGGGEGVQPVRSHVGLSSAEQRAFAKRLKFGG